MIAVPISSNIPLSDTRTSRTAHLPLVVDLDGTLTPTDTLTESVLKLIKQRPANLLALPFWLIKGRSFLKARIAERVDLPVASLPLRHELIDYLKAEKARGRTLMLATAAHRRIAEPFARRLGLFDTILASDEQTNLKGKTKLAAIQQHYPQGFVYAGDSKADLPIWAQAEGAVLVGASPQVSAQVRDAGHVECEFGGARPNMALWLRALRVHQWAKNLLLFVPLLTGFAFFDPVRVLSILMAFVAFSLIASSTYLVNDLWDLDSDRIHLRKRHRPFASGSIGIAQGIAVAGLLLCTAFVLAAAVSAAFAGMLALYLVLTSAYSWSLKRYVLIDVLMLAVLYTMRILAGSVAVHMRVTSWLLAFSVFAFFSLALVKRCSELVSLQQMGAQSAHGRDYQVSDLSVLWPLGCASSIASVVVFGLFISAPETVATYASHQLLWVAGLGLIYWQARLWIKTSRGEMHDDPLVFAMRDFGSRLTMLSVFAIMVAARFTY
jgi:4-hydroxybenzoate polyprenyltransferase/phosphoserine phosphatase